MGKISEKKPPAVVVGLCAHGLDLVRSLFNNGVEVYAVDSNKKRPGNKTRLAKLHIINDINGEDLIQGLVDLSFKIGNAIKPVLFLTNDNMVFQVAKDWQKLEKLYMLSWASHREKTKEFLIKSNLENYCKQIGVKYPESYIIASENDYSKISKDLIFPQIIKPSKPLSKFKAIILKSPKEIPTVINTYSSAMPFILQQWIPGPVSHLFFCALYLDRGRPLAHFEGRKLDSLPKGLGTTTIAEPFANQELFEETVKFFEGFKPTGPVSLEFKLDNKGTFWIIEPTLFRTDYWLGCCVANMVNFPYIEYCHQVGLDIPSTAQKDRKIWVDIERDPLCFFRLFWPPGVIIRRRKRFVFTYFSAKDIFPLFACVIDILIRVGGFFIKKVFRIIKFPKKLGLEK